MIQWPGNVPISSTSHPFSAYHPPGSLQDYPRYVMGGTADPEDKHHDHSRKRSESQDHDADVLDRSHRRSSSSRCQDPPRSYAADKYRYHSRRHSESKEEHDDRSHRRSSSHRERDPGSYGRSSSRRQNPPQQPRRRDICPLSIMERCYIERLKVVTDYNEWMRICFQLKKINYPGGVPLPDNNVMNLHDALRNIDHVKFTNIVKNLNPPLTEQHHIIPATRMISEPSPVSSSPFNPTHRRREDDDPRSSTTTTDTSSSSDPRLSPYEPWDYPSPPPITRRVVVRIQGMDVCSSPNDVHQSICELLKVRHSIKMKWWVHMGGVGDVDIEKKEKVAPVVTVEVDIHPDDWSTDAEQRLDNLRRNLWAKSCTFVVL